MKLSEMRAKLERSAFALPLAVLVAGLTLAISEAAYHGADSQLSTLQNVAKGRLELLRVVSRVTDAETGQRGYLLTGRSEYLDPYRYASNDASEGLAALQRQYAGSGQPDAEALRQEIASSVTTKLSEMAEILRLYDAGRPDSARELIMTDIGRDLMESIRSHTQVLLALQNSRIIAGFDSVFNTLLLNRIGIAAMTAISLLVVVMLLRQSQQLEQQRRDQLARTLAERNHLEHEVARRTTELTELARHLQTAREDERARLARDLHDELGALLTAAKLDLARIRPKLQVSLPEALPRLVHLAEMLNAGIALKRRIIEDLRPSTLDQLGLVPALEILCREFADQTGIRLHTDLQPVQLTASGQLTVFRMVQESLNNVAKYAQATELTVTLASDGDQVLVRVSDNGLGFDPAKVTRATHGLVGMRYRLEAEQGELRVQSAPAQGTTISARLPIHIPADLPTDPSTDPSTQPPTAAAEADPASR